jgi:hypothetical protein
VPIVAGFVGVRADGLVGVEVQITFDGKAEFAAHRTKLREADVAEFGASQAEIAEAEGEGRWLRRFR